MSLAAKVKPVPHIDIATLYGPMSVLGPINPAETLDREALAKVVDGLERTLPGRTCEGSSLGDGFRDSKQCARLGLGSAITAAHATCIKPRA
jgi:hypothetical protein